MEAVKDEWVVMLTVWNAGRKAKGEIVAQKEQGKMLTEKDRGLPVLDRLCTHDVLEECRGAVRNEAENRSSNRVQIVSSGPTPSTLFLLITVALTVEDSQKSGSGSRQKSRWLVSQQNR